MTKTIILIIMKTEKNLRIKYRSHERFKRTAYNLLQLTYLPTTEVCEYVYGSKKKKSTLNQKKTGASPLFFEESCKIIDYYGKVADEIIDIIND